MSRRIYVAGGSDERLACKADIEALRAGHWDITHDWTNEPGFQDPPKPNRERSITLDLRGVAMAPFFWLRVPASKSEGAAVELGAALILRDMLSFPALGFGAPRCIIVSGPWDSGHRLFTHAADLKFSSHPEALRWLLDYAP